MKRLLNLAVLTVLALPLVAETITVAQTTGGKTVRTTSTITTTQKDGLFWETSTSKDGTSRTGSTETGEVRSLEVTAPEGKILLTSDGSVLKVAGTWDTKPLSGTLDIKGKVWSLNFDQALKFYAKKGFSGAMPFLMINPGDLAHPTAMNLTREGIETIRGKSAVRLKIALDGAMALFWSAKVWADPESGATLRYQGNSGPGTPDSVIEVESVVP